MTWKVLPKAPQEEFVFLKCLLRLRPSVLADRLREAGFEGEWHIFRDGLHRRFVATDGQRFDWWPSTGRLVSHKDNSTLAEWLVAEFGEAPRRTLDDFLV